MNVSSSFINRSFMDFVAFIAGFVFLMLINFTLDIFQGNLLSSYSTHYWLSVFYLACAVFAWLLVCNRTLKRFLIIMFIPGLVFSVSIIFLVELPVRPFS